MSTPTYLMTALQQNLQTARARAKLHRLEAELKKGEPDEVWHTRLAEEIESNLLGWELAAECIRETIRINDVMSELLTGRPAAPSRPPLRVV